MAITKYDQFDFLIDIVPRDDIKPNKIREDGTRTSSNPDQVIYFFIYCLYCIIYCDCFKVHYYFQLAQQHHANLQQNNSPGNTTSTSNTVSQPQSIQIVQPQQVQTVQINSLEQVCV